MFTSTLSNSVVICLAEYQSMLHPWNVFSIEIDGDVISIHNTFKSIADGQKVININTNQ